MATTTARHPDLTPFGFTPTESAVYFALLKRGPSSGYALAQEMSLARANAYQALRGLVTKKAALSLGGTPERYRAIRPDALYAQIVEQQGARLDRLEAQLASLPEEGADAVVTVAGRRAVLDWWLRTAARETEPVTIVAPGSLLTALVPALRKRTADGSTTHVWVVGADGEPPVPTAGTVPAERMREYFPADTAFMLTPSGVLLVTVEGSELRAFWTGDPTIVGTTRAAVAGLTRAGESR